LRAKRGQASECILDVDLGIKLNPSVRNVLTAATALGVANDVLRGGDSSAIRRSLTALEGQLPSQELGAFFELAHLRVRGEKLLAAGDWSGAVTLARRSDKVDFPAGSREYLGRALVAAAKHSTAQGEKQKLYREALQAYAVVALKAGVVWSRPDGFPPGFYADQLESYLHCAMTAHISGADQQRAQLAFKSLQREESDPLR
jgi:hypothetical protein